MAAAGRAGGRRDGCVLVEIDMGTLTLRRFARKFRGTSNGKRRFDVLVLTQSSRRLEALRRVAGRLVPNERHDNYYLTMFDDALAPSKFSAAV